MQTEQWPSVEKNDMLNTRALHETKEVTLHRDLVKQSILAKSQATKTRSCVIAEKTGENGDVFFNSLDSQAFLDESAWQWSQDDDQKGPCSSDIKCFAAQIVNPPETNISMENLENKTGSQNSRKQYAFQDSRNSQFIACGERWNFGSDHQYSVMIPGKFTSSETSIRNENYDDTDFETLAHVF
ncbi:uncharacterized protein LOC124443223 [Xenia sp. Carnegie-2017]|uniref:uncharacterized protein LOC124443223 n=1 Tax=Xenia sp. Carnegie-2017 TaxID=2897299 RepID=UPI001F046BA8|nr:uncharacterized protein LOC124443223 [Xenia sp. Carnegie-2017]